VRARRTQRTQGPLTRRGVRTDAAAQRHRRQRERGVDIVPERGCGLAFHDPATSTMVGTISDTTTKGGGGTMSA